MDSVKKIWLSGTLIPIIWIVSLCIAHWINIQCARIFFPLFLVYIIFMLKLWFGKEDDLGKIYDDYKKLGLMTIILVILRMQWGIILNAPIGSSWDYFMSRGWIKGSSPLGFILDTGLLLLILFYFTFKKGDYLEKVTLWTGLGSVGFSFVILLLQKYFSAPTKIAGAHLQQVSPKLGIFLGSLTFWGFMAILAIGVFILGASLPAKKGGSILAPLGFSVIVCFLIFCFVVKVSGGKPLEYFVKPEVIAGLKKPGSEDPPKNPPPFSRVRKGNIVIHSFNPGKKIMKSTFTDEFIVLAVDSSESKIFLSAPKNQLIRKDLNPTDVIFSRTKDFSNPSDWLSVKEIKTKNCNPGTVYVTVNCINSSIARSRGIGGTINVTYQEKT